jgi:hypothetical protein
MGSIAPPGPSRSRCPRYCARFAGLSRFGGSSTRSGRRTPITTRSTARAHASSIFPVRRSRSVPVASTRCWRLTRSIAWRRAGARTTWAGCTTNGARRRSGSPNSERNSISSCRSRAYSLGTSVAFTERCLANWTESAERLDQELWGLERQVYIDRHERHDWFDRHGDELAQLAAARLELHDRGAQDREERINDIRRDPPDWVTDRIGPRPDEPAAREHWDRAAAHLDDYREAFGHPPTSERPPPVATTATDTPGRTSTAAPPRPSNCTPTSRPSNCRPNSTATSASTSAYDHRRLNPGYLSPPVTCDIGQAQTPPAPGRPPRRQP